MQFIPVTTKHHYSLTLSFRNHSNHHYWCSIFNKVLADIDSIMPIDQIQY